MTGIDLVQVPSKRATPALNGVIPGQVQLLITGVSSAIPHVRSGTLQALGVTRPKRKYALPDAPAIAQNVPACEVLACYAVFLPGSKPAADRQTAA